MREKHSLKVSKKKFLLSVVIPVYNESERIYNLPEIFQYLIRSNFNFEVIVINDGSTDDTLAKLKKIQKQYSFRIISYYPNKGKGYAIKKGMLAASGDYRLFTDVDLSTPIEEFDHFLPYLHSHEIVIATRKKKGAHLKIRQGKTRENLGKAYTLLSKRILNLPLSDFTCGFKVFSKQAAEKIFSKSQIERWGFDPEILFIATKNKIRIKEVSVTWINNPNSKVRFPQDAINSFCELIRIKVNDFIGKYN